ncbi:DUF4118 domain-containing protein [Azoarcus sp. KH32C]|uniref:DUF4118 domain-containing protein n=1 Tax=Azoarcus sp. KH32C TaxID=748247 RepID=UPI0002385EB3|nr:DUF4118 domain-containing protein [Azoarcus sp. KH32C]BAL23977.1 two-component system, OmpR family, sensor histidine kinase [Azoarcus sp. KH32C]
MENDSLERHSPVTRHLFAVFACALMTAICLLLRGVFDITNIAMLMLLPVVFVAARLGRGPAILASFVTVALFDFFFVPPQLSFAVSDVQYLVIFAVMLAVSLFISHLTASLKASARDAQQREQRSQALYTLARTLAGAVSADEAVTQVVRFVREQAGGEARLFVPDADDKIHEFPHSTGPLSMDKFLTIEAVYLGGDTVGASATVNLDGACLILPLIGSTRRRGVLFVAAHVDDDHIYELRSMLEAVASLTAIALERLHFVEIAQASQLETEAERLRSSILSSISHDIRTPLTVLFGQADALALASSHLDDQEREAAQAIRDQAGRLHEMVDKLLDMARLQAGKVHLSKEWQPIDEVIGASIQLLGDALRDHPVTVTLAPELPLVAIDAVLMERVCCNLLENAAKYSPPGAPIAVTVTDVAGSLLVEVRDRGPGFPPASLKRIFNLFERGTTESTAPGVGLGLAICRAIVEAHGGQIDASNAPEGGACVRFSLPCGQAPQLEPEPVDPAGARP